MKGWVSKCRFGSRTEDEEYWTNFYNAHTQKIREFATNHLSMAFVELELEGENMGELLEYFTGVPSSCLMDCHPGTEWLKQNPNATKCHPPIQKK